MQHPVRYRVVIVSPALSDANNGNWQTARRWQIMLSERFDVRIVKDWHPDADGLKDDVMLALHARRSADSVQRWVAHAGHDDHGTCPSLAVVLTGTDLYRDIQSDASAQASLQVAGKLVVLQSLGIHELPPGLQAKTRAILQSTTTRETLHKSARTLRCIAVGHLRSEKSPDTLMHAAALLDDIAGLRINHLGAPLQPDLEQLARQTTAQHAHYRWLGALPHEATRRRIQQAHVLVHPSRMEGGAHVVMEAVCSGTPVLASHISGNVGMLGEDYEGYFPLGDAQALAALIRQLRADLKHSHENTFYARLKRQCAARAPLFAPQREQRELIALVDALSGRPSRARGTVQ